MRRLDRKVTNPIELESIFRSSTLCHLAMIDEGRPYIVPMNFGYADGALYLHSAPVGRKISVLKENPEVCFSIVARHEIVENERACSWTARLSSVIGTGRARIVTEKREVEKGLTVLMAQYSDKTYDFSGEDLDGVVIIRVEIETLTGKSSETAKR